MVNNINDIVLTVLAETAIVAIVANEAQEE